MQRKFKLIKKFPGSPTLNTIITIESSQETGYYSENKEFWQEIIEIPVGTKAYNSLIQSTIIKKEDGWYKIPSDSDLKTSYTDEDILKQKRFQIVEETKPVLFTTEDGKDIYEYDAIWVVSSNFNTIYTTAFSNKYGNSKTLYKIVFSNKKAAEEYILWNKPCLSLNDVASIYPGVNKNHSNTPSHQAERLKELVKSKL